MKVKDIMTRRVITLNADEELVFAEELMGLRRIRHMPVVDNGHIVGIVTHRDLLRASVSTLGIGTWMDDRRLKASVPVRKIMHKQVATVSPEADVKEAARVMREGKYGCLPVVDHDARLVGIVTEADFVRIMEDLIAHLEVTDPEWMAALGARVAAEGDADR